MNNEVDLFDNHHGHYNHSESLEFTHGKTASYFLGAQAILGSVWWFLSLFIFIPNTYQLDYYGIGTAVPVLWFWGNLADQKHGYTAVAYFSIFTMFAICSVVEMFSFYWQRYRFNVQFMAFWTSGIGYWTSIIGYALPGILSLCQILLPVESGGLGENKEFSNNAIFLTIASFIIWLVTASIHIIYVPVYQNYVNTVWTPDKCLLVCGSL